MKLVLILFLVSTIFSCHQSQTSDETQTRELELKPELSLLEVSTNHCLQVERIMAHLQSPRFQFPAAMMTTQFRSLNDIPIAKDQFMSYASFYYKTGIPQDFNLLKVATQKDCNTIQLYTSSRELLNFKITESSDQHLKFVLTDQFDLSLSQPKKRALKQRIQPYEYDVILISDKKLKIIEKFLTFDPLCLTKNRIKFESTKIISWGRQASELPQQYEIEASFLNKVNSALMNSIGVNKNTLSVADIKSFMQSPIREDLKLCL